MPLLLPPPVRYLPWAARSNTATASDWASRRMKSGTSAPASNSNDTPAAASTLTQWGAMQRLPRLGCSWVHNSSRCRRCSMRRSQHGRWQLPSQSQCRLPRLHVSGQRQHPPTPPLMLSALQMRQATVQCYRRLLLHRLQRCETQGR